MLQSSQRSYSTITILENKQQFSPIEIIKGDTIQTDSVENGETHMPGGSSYIFTPAQDSAYYRALRQRLPVVTRLNNDISAFSSAIEERLREYEESPWKLAMKNIESIPSEYLTPSGSEQVRYDENIRMSQYVPHMKTWMPYGLKLGVSDVLTLFGLKEDVTPIIRYTLEYPEEIEIVIYSINATVIAVLDNRLQQPGSHTITWNGRNDAGRLMPSGDYIGEVRIGKLKYVRKRIVIP